MSRHDTERKEEVSIVTHTQYRKRTPLTQQGHQQTEMLVFLLSLCDACSFSSHILCVQYVMCHECHLIDTRKGGERDPDIV